ncbi:MAG TPA: hypothetical protein ENN73_06380, partial [Firmicutes bacterium]|nr:hypothetical protein [Bacillota bacterium]
PMYIMEGCSESFSYDWDMQGLMVLRDAFINNKFYTLPEMRNFYYNPNVYLCYKESHAFIDFLIEEYGDDKMKLLFRNIRRNPKINFDKILYDTYSLNEEELSEIWINYMKKKFWPMIKDKEVPQISYGKPIGETGEYINTFKPAYLPSGDLFAYITTKNQQFDIFIKGADDKNIIKRLTKQDDLFFEYIIVDGNALNISPDGNWAALFVRDNEADKLLLINIITEETRKIKFEGFESMSSPSWGSDSKTIVFAADKTGSTDIWSYHIETGKFEQWTDDNCEDFHPRFSQDMKTVYYVSEFKGRKKIYTIKKGDFNSKKQITFGNWDDIQPFLSKDEKKIIFISGRVDDIPNLFELDLEKNEVIQLTNTLGGIFDPAYSPDNSEIIFSCYYNGTFKIFRKKTKEFHSIADFYNDESDKVEEFCFLEKKSYKLSREHDIKFKLEPSFVYSNLEFSTAGELKNYTLIGLSDIMEDHLFIISINSIQQFSDSYFVYMFRKYRMTFGASIFNFGNYYFFPVLNEVGIHRNYGGSLFMSYPLNKYNRVELYTTFAQLYWDPIFQVYFNLPRYEHELSADFRFIRDTARWAQFDPISGERYVLMVKQYMTPRESFKKMTEYGIDYRKYFRLSRRASYALRLFGIWSTGPDQYIRFFGGGNQLRGFEFNQFYGSRVAFINNEFRIPFIDIIRLFGFLDLYYIRGVLFWDIGSAWSDDYHWEPFRKDENGNWRFEDIKSSVGSGLRLRGGYFDFNFYFAKKMDLHKIYPNTIYQFYIGSNF